MTRYAHKVDSNQSEIERAYRQLLGDKVTDASAWGDGCPDLFLSFGGEFTDAFGCWAEIKRDDKATFTAHQIRFKNAHPGTVRRIETVEQAIEHATWIRAQVKRLAE